MAPPRYKLYSPPASSFAFAPLVVSEYVGVDVEVVKQEGIEELIVAKSPTGKSPVLETPNGDVIVSSQAIARFLAGLRHDTNILGSVSLKESLAIEDWINWASQELELPACVSYYMVAGCIPFNEDMFAKVKRDLSSGLGFLESYLKSTRKNDQRKTMKTCLVKSEHITVADIVIACTLVYPFTLVFDEADLESYPILIRWFEGCMQEPEFFAVLGNIKCGRGKH